MSRPRSPEPQIRMTRGETIFGWVFLPFYLFLNGLAIQHLLLLLHKELDLYTINLIYFYVNFLAVCIGCRKYLSESLKQLRVLPLLVSLLGGFAVYFLGSVLLGFLLPLLPAFSNPADKVTTEMIAQRGNIMRVCAIFLGPLVEEVLMRGLIFAPLSRKSRLLAYVVSTLAFSTLHLWQFVGSVPLQELLLSLLSYIPGSVALAFAYERSGNIWSSIVLHMLINGLSFWAVTVI